MLRYRNKKQRENYVNSLLTSAENRPSIKSSFECRYMWNDTLEKQDKAEANMFWILLRQLSIMNHDYGRHRVFPQ